MDIRRSAWMQIATFCLVACSFVFFSTKSAQAQCNIAAYTLTVVVDSYDSYNLGGCGSPGPVSSPITVPAGSSIPVSISATGVSGAGSYAVVRCSAYAVALGTSTTIYNNTITQSLYTTVSWTPTVPATYAVSCNAYYYIPFGVGNTGTIYTGVVNVPVV
jgi:hypothetical protein